MRGDYLVLADISKITMGQSPESSTYNENGDGLPFFQGNADFGKIHPHVRVWCTSPKKIAQKNDILISVRAPIGALNIANQECCIGRGLAAIQVDEKTIDREYLWFFLNSKVDFLNTQGTGSTFKAINKNILADLKVRVYDKKIQKTIVEKLNTVTSLLEKSAKYKTKLDELIKSRFVEMFGDVILNTMGWNIAKIGQIVTEVRYGTSRPATENGKYPYLRMNNLTYNGYLDLSDLKRIDIPDNEIEKCIVRNGDILFNRTNSIELVGKTCVFNEPTDMIIAGYIIRIRLKPIMLPIVFSCFMNTEALKTKLRNMAKGAVNQANINAQELQNIEIYVPPIDLQTQFVDFVTQVEKQKATVQKSIDKLETLKKSLMQEYFG